jgi:hypothetical protein
VSFSGCRSLREAKKYSFQVAAVSAKQKSILFGSPRYARSKKVFFSGRRNQRQVKKYPFQVAAVFISFIERVIWSNTLNKTGISHPEGLTCL